MAPWSCCWRPQSKPCELRTAFPSCRWHCARPLASTENLKARRQAALQASWFPELDNGRAACSKSGQIPRSRLSRDSLADLRGQAASLDVDSLDLAHRTCLEGRKERELVARINEGYQPQGPARREMGGALPP